MKPSEWNIAVVGAGNLAWSLIPNLQQAGARVTQLITRNTETGNHYCKTYRIPYGNASVDDLRPEINLVFLTVSDRAIEPLARQLARILSAGTLVLHTSGSVPIAALDALGERKGVFYPLQIFTRSWVTDLKEVPLFLEGSKSVTQWLFPLAEALSQKVYRLNSEERLRLHLGAVLACNFPNYLYRMAAEMNPQLGFEVYGPLIRETVDKALAFHPNQTQTGPAIRGDKEVLTQHLQLLQKHPEWQELYRMISLLINPRLKDDLI